MIDFPIVDSHVHLWDPGHFRMPWLDGEEVLGKPFGPADLTAHAAPNTIGAYVYVEVDVEPHVALLEARWVEDIARRDPRLKGIVANAPVENGAQLAAYLDALVQVGPRVKGVRRLLQGEGDPEFCLRPRFVEGVRLLARYGLSFDICIRHAQLAASTELVRRCPDTQFVLDHIGKADIRVGLLDPWREGIRALAALPNVVCKLSGMVTEADLTDWKPADLAPYVAHVIACFGEDRVMFGGDWPVVLKASPYARWVDTLDGLTAGLSPAAKRKLWSDNARRVYRLG